MVKNHCFHLCWHSMHTVARFHTLVCCKWCFILRFEPRILPTYILICVGVALQICTVLKLQRQCYYHNGSSDPLVMYLACKFKSVQICQNLSDDRFDTFFCAKNLSILSTDRFDKFFGLKYLSNLSVDRFDRFVFCKTCDFTDLTDCNISYCVRSQASIKYCIQPQYISRL